MNAFAALSVCLVAALVSSASAGLIAAPLPGPLLHAPLLAAPAPILTAPAVVGHAPVLLGHAPVAAATHIGAPIAAHTFSRPIATYATTHNLLGAPLAVPALAAPGLPFGAPAFAAPLGAPLLARPALAAAPLPLAAPALLARPAYLK